MSKTESGSTSKTQSNASSPRDDWTSVSDLNERRKIQNRIAQRKFRDKARHQRVIDEQRQAYERRAAAAYTPPDPNELDVDFVSGPPWGSIPLKYIIQLGMQKEPTVQSRLRHNSAPTAGGSTRPGLHLIDQYARGVPAWTTWRQQRPVVETITPMDTDSSMLSDR